MLDRYEPAAFEAKWRQRWKDEDVFATREEPGRPKFYGLDFFPYPSGAGLSVGHCRNYVPTDALCRFKFMQGHNVLHPMGFDAFGLPAENEAIKRKSHPAPMIEQYAANYRRQMDLVGISYDWSRSFKSSDPDYYRWTQWVFELLYKRGLAYRRDATVNWCPKDKTALANEEVVGGLCERCGTPVEKRSIPQWFFKITEYAQRLIDDLDDIDWPEGIKVMQRNWIGRSEGVQFQLPVVVGDDDGTEAAHRSHKSYDIDSDTVSAPPLTLEVFTTRIDTIFGVTFCVVAPEHPLVDAVLRSGDPGVAAQADAVRAYRDQAAKLSDTARQAENREKTGVFTGAYAVNPMTRRRVPIWVADYVMMGYGTGAIMAVPAGDQRDFEFACQFGLPVVPIQEPGDAWLKENGNGDLASYLEDPKRFKAAFVSKDRPLVGAGEYSGMAFDEAARALGVWVESEGIGQRTVQYRLRDWLISRQRYWGCPIPVVYSQEGDAMLVPEDQLPVELPPVDHYEPGDNGESPLSLIPEFVNATTPEGTLGRRETDTMGGFACSSWYFLRFCDPHNDAQAWDPDKVAAWMPVDTYVGGAEHAVMHLLYARFWTKVLYDAGLVPVKEPFQKLVNQGQVLGLTPYRKPREGEVLDVGEDGILVTKEEAAALPEQVEGKRRHPGRSRGGVRRGRLAPVRAVCRADRRRRPVGQRRDDRHIAVPEPGLPLRGRGPARVRPGLAGADQRLAGGRRARRPPHDPPADPQGDRGHRPAGPEHLRQRDDDRAQRVAGPAEVPGRKRGGASRLQRGGRDARAGALARRASLG
jgi:leucyl-tRNA synthetase